MLDYINFFLRFLVIYVHLNVKQTFSQDLSCNPVNSCAENSVGTKVADPEDCYRYYICISDSQGNSIPSDNSFECKPNTYFNTNYGDCYSGTCVNKCINICPTGCINYDYERYPDPKSCSHFYQCDPGHIIERLSCPFDAPYFDGSICTSSIYACCDTCVPYCNKQFTEVQDPYDCRSYYVCLSVGIPSESDRYDCAAGLYFDTSVGDCEYESTPCYPLCGNGTLSDVELNKENIL